jgi:uncharacterized protein YqgC (DUF456 family)
LEIHDILAGLAVLVGLVGIVVPILPGLALQVVAVALWAFEESNFTGWVVLGLAVGLAAAATVFKYLFPGRRLKATGVPGWVLLAAVLVGVIGLFALPVIGAPIGFVLTIYFFERARKGKALAWPSTKGALRAVLTSIGIELVGGFSIAVLFFVGALLT